MESQRSAIAHEEAKKAKLKLEEKLAQEAEQRAELEEQIKQKDQKLAQARQQELDFRRKQRELEEKTKELDLSVEKRLAEALGPERAKAKREAFEEQRLRLAERDKTINDLQRQLQEAARKAEQGSEQLRGEVRELDLEATLCHAFPRDTFEDVPKGQSGADIVHRVVSNVGQLCGSILWEAKRTMRWNDNWLGKLRQDQRAAKAEMAVIVSDAMPRGIEHFEDLDGVWVTCPALVVPLATTLRMALVDTASARCASDGQQTKMHLLYQYLTSPQFKQRVDGIIEGYITLKQDLEDEKRSTLKRWAVREKRLELVLGGIAGMYGDLQGIAGKTLPEIEGLEVALLPLD